MGQVGNVLMVDGGWGFWIGSAAENSRRLWVAYESEETASRARTAIVEALEGATLIADEV